MGKRREGTGNATYLIQVTDSHDNTLFIELSKDGSYWNVNSGGIFRKGYANKKETVAKTEPQQPNNAVSNGSAAMSGKIKAVDDAIKEQSAASDAEVDAITNGDGMIVLGTTRGGEQVYIIGGNVVLNGDNSVNKEGSSAQLTVVRDGKRTTMGIVELESVDAPIDAAGEKVSRRTAIEENLRRQQRIDMGEEHVFTPGETFETPNGEVQFVADRGDGTADITVNGVAGVYNVADLSDMYVAAQQMAYNAERNAENIQQTNTSASTGEGGSAENLQQGNDNKVVGEEKPSAPVDAIPMDKRGKEERAAYHMVPIARTLEDLHDGALEQQEIDGLIDARVKEAAKDLEDLQKKKPAIGADKNAYLKAKEQWQADVQNAQKVLDYYNELRAKEDEITKSEHAPITAPEDVAEIATADEYVAGLLGGIKITPESFRKETGLSKEEQKKMVGVIASEDNGGISIERASELIAENYGEELRGLGFTGDMMDIRDMLIDILSSGHPKTYAKRGKEQRVAEALEQERAAADSWTSENFGFASYDDLIAYEETLIPNMIQKYAGFDEQTYFNTLAENYEYDTTRESERVGPGSEVLQGERSVPADGTESIGERNQGGAVQYDVQGGAETTDAQETLNPSDVTAKAANEMQPAEMDQVEDNLEKVTVDNQGNPMGVDGKLVVEEVANIDEITDEDFEIPTRNVQLPAIPENVANAIGTNGRPVVIKKNVFEKNGNTHVELEPEDSRNILRSALYNPNIVGSTQPIRRPDYKVAIRTGEQNAVVVLDVYHGKDFVEIVGWRMVNEKGLAKMQRQAEREGGQFLILSPNDGSAAALSALPLGLSSEGEDKNSISNSQENEQKSGENGNTGANEAENREVERASQTEGETSNGSTISQDSEQVSDQDNAPYTIAPAQYTTKKGKVLDMHLVKFAGTLTKEQQRAAKELAKAEKGWYDREQDGFMMRSEESAKQLADTILNNDDAVSDAQPVSMTDIQALNNGDVLFTEPQQTKGQETQQTPFKTEKEAKDYLVSIGYSPDSQYMNNPKNEAQDYIDEANYQMRKHSEQPTNPSGNRLVTDERYAELRERMRKKLGGQMNIGIDPEILAIGTEMAVYHLEKGARKFTEYAKAMIADLGDAIRPYLKAFYNGARNLPEVESSEIAADMTPYDEVQQFNVATFDKEHSDPFTTAEIVVAEQVHQEEAEQAKQEIINQRNTERRNEDEQTSASTEAIASQAETVADKAESDIETATTEEQLNDVVATIDKQIEEVNKQLALLGYYEADIDDSQFHESYGYMRSAEKKAVKDADTLAKRIVKDLGIDPASIVDKKGKKRKVIAQANIAPAGGNVYIHLPLTEDRELYISVDLEPDYKGGNRDNLFIDHIMLRIENPTEQGYRYVGRNVWVQSDATYTDVLDEIRAEIIQHVPEFDLPTRQSVSETEQKQPKAKKSKKKAINLQQSGELGLFDSLFDNETNNEDGLQRNDDVRAGGLQSDGNRHEQGLSRGSETGSESEQQDSRGTDLGGERTGDAVDRTVRPRLSDTVEDKGIEGKRKKDVENNRKLADELKGVTLFVPDTFGVEHELSGFTYYELENVFHFTDNINGQRNATRKELDAILKIARKNNGKEEISEPKNTRNNHSERGKDHAPTSVDARIEANIKAIELAKQLLESGEQATEKQMQTLRKFSGWGGLGKAFSEGTYYAPNLIAKRLRELLGEAAYQEAVMSANSAYYTPAYVVDTLWDIAEQMGFKGGNILEGSAGIGNILGQMPTHISERSNIHAIEIDGTSGGILSLLYPDAKVEIQGFEETRIANGSVDLAITNVPFVTGLRVNDTTGDKDLSKKFHNIHDFCIAKNVRKLREGGLGIFITSNGTLDSSKKLRDWIVSEGGADFVGAFRMHNKTFGGTGVTSDIIVIRKRVNGQKSANAIDVSTVTGERMAEYDTGETRKVKGKETPVIKQLSMDYNRYFVEHPENMAGEMHFAFEKGDTFRPTSKGLYPKQDKKQEQMLAEFVQSFTAEEFGERTTDDATGFAEAMQGKKLGELFVKDGKLYTYTLQGAKPLEVNANKVKGHTKVECFEAYTAIKEALAEVLAYQTSNESDEGLKPLLDSLNRAYDDFVATYGHFNKNTAIAFLRNDVDYASVFALERFEETADANGNKVQKFGKTDVFSKRVVEKEKEPTPTNVKDGIIASIFKFGRVDVPYIAEQLGVGIEDVKKEIIESGYGFENPATRQIEASYQYLSGNVREKLRQAEENNENGAFDRNIKALQEVMPMEIPAHLIDFTLGSSWIDPKLYEDYVKERTEVAVQFTAVGGTWFMKEPYFTNYEKNRAMGVTSEMLGRTIMGHTLIEAAIQNRSITISTTKKRYDGSTETITDKEATQACAAKIDEIRQDFKDWARQKMQSDPEMSALIERIYNDTFNNFVPMSIPDEFVPEYFGGASHEFKMRPHQGKAIVRGTQQPLLLAHEVGTGKTFTLISTAMEMRRLGTARKPMIVVQNATVGQFVASAKELYPNAKILTLEEADRTAEGRKNFYAKIRYNDWDMIVVPQSTFEFIPDSEEREMAFVQDKIEEKMLILEKMKEEDPDGKSMITRQAEREIELLEEQLAGLSGETGKKRTANEEKKRAVALQNAEVKATEMLDRRTDDVENFDDMGIDALLIDEAHEYKHLGFATAMQRGVKGVDPSYSKKSQGVFLKTQAVLEKNNGRNVIFATGTPISNTAAEIWTFMRYLMPADTMKEYGIYYFDDFVRNFGNIQQMLEFTTSGKFKENNRFAGYVNLPELVRIWSGVSDTVLTKEAGDVIDKIPDMEGGKAQDLYLPQTRALRSIMKYVKGELEKYEQMSGKEKKENSHIPLTMYGIAKAAAVDARLVQADAEDDPHSKTNEAVRQTLRALNETADYKGTVAIFADNYQNKESGFNLYEDIRTKLIAEGVPADEIVVIKSGMTVKKKLEIFEKVNRGEVRVILGSTFTLGTGVNIQERLHTLIHLDAPNRPMDYTQRNGRILRQGNLHKAMGKPVRILRFGVEDSLDVTAYQRLKTKGAIADSIMNGKQMMSNSMINRVLEEEEDVFGDTVAQLSGSEYAMLKNNAEKNMRKYASRKKQYEADQTYIHNAKPRVKAFIKDAEKRIEDNSRYLEAVRSSFPDGKFKEIVIGKHRFTSVEAMEDFFKEHNKSVLAEMKQMKDGEIAGEQKRELTIQIGDFSFVVTTKLTRQTMRDGATLFNDVERKMTYSCAELGIEDIPVRQNLLRNAIEDITHNVITGRDFSERLEAAERSKKHNEAELEQLLSREGKPFEYEAELEQAKAQYEEYAELMKKELEQKEAKYAEMDANVEVADNLLNTDEDDDTLYRSDDATKNTIDAVKKAGVEVVEATPEMVQAVLGAEMMSVNERLLRLDKVSKVVSNWLKNNVRGRSIKVELPVATQRKIRAKMGRDFGSHVITANNVAHSKKNHGENGIKNTENSIPLRDEDFALMPYIMVSPSYVERGSFDSVGSESVRFYKVLSNGYVVVVEKEQKNSPNDMETITMWAELSANVPNARNMRPSKSTSETVTISPDDAAKIRKDAENAIRADVKLEKSTAAAPFYSNAKKAVLDIKQEKATPQQWVAMLKKNGGLKAGEDAWVGLEAWLNEQSGSVTKQQILDYIDENAIQIEEVQYSQFGYGMMDEAANNLEAETKAIGWDAMKEKYPGIEEYFEYDNGEILWSEARASVGEYEDFILDNRIVDVNPSDEAINETREKYTTEGLKRKREIALVVPTIESWNESDEVHFGDAGNGRAVAWVRFGETTDSEGNRVLVIDEIQSKRHQDGRENGYGGATSEDVKSALEAVNAAQSEFDEYNAEMAKKYGSEYDWNIDATDAEIDKWQELYDKVAQLGQVYEDVAESNRKGIPSAPFEKNWHELAMKRMLRYAAENGFDKVAWTTGKQQAERYNLSRDVDLIQSVDNNMEVFSDGTPVAKDVRVMTGRNTINFKVGEDGIIHGGEFAGKNVTEVFGKELGEKIMTPGTNTIEEDGLKIGGEGMKGFYDRMLPSFVQKYTKKWGAKVGEVTMPSLKQNNTMWSVDVTPQMTEEVMRGQPMFLRTEDGTVYGWAVNGKIFLTPEGMNPNTPAHEYTHLWAAMVEKNDPKLWSRIVEAMKESPTWNEVLLDEAYSDIHNNDSRMASEVLSRLSGEENYRRAMEQAEQEIKAADGIVEKAKKIALWGRIKQVLADFWASVKGVFGLTDKMPWTEFVDMALGDLYAGVNPNAEGSPLEKAVYGGNSGYVGYSMSKRAARAREEGRFPKTDFKKEYGVSENAFNALVKAGMIDNSEWHHTSMYGNKTTFYGWDEPEYAEYYQTNKAVIDKLARENGEELSKMLDVVVDEIAEKRYQEFTKRQEERKREDELRKEYEEYLDTLPVPETYISEKGVKVITNGSRRSYRWEFYRPDGKKMNQAGKAVEELERYLATQQPTFEEWKAQKDDIRSRDGEGSITDEEVAVESDPVSKVLGKPRGTRKQRNMFAQRERKRMRDAVEQVAGALNTPIVVLDSTEGLTGRRAKAKGWYEKSTGRIVVVLPNNRSVTDVMQTVLHEAVAHYGLRKLFGSGFDNFIDNIYNNVDAETRRRINLLASRNGWNLKVATEEYLASLAEDANFERVNPSIWQRIKSFFLDMLAEAGVRLDIELSDNELRYILWRSYQNLKNPGKYRTIVDEARDIAKQGELRVGNYAENVRADVNVAEESDAEYDTIPSEEFMQANMIASNWSNSHKGAARCIVILNGDSLNGQLKRAGFTDGEITSAIENYERGTIAAYFPTSDKVVIYNVNASKDEIIGYLWHENAHRAIGEILTSGEMERVFNAIYGEQSQETKKQLAMMGYKAEEQAEEGIIRSFEECFLNETLRKKVERGLKPKEGISEDAMLAVNTINNIVNFIKYGREGKRTTESGRGTVGDITQQSAKENGAGRDVEVRNSEGASKTQRRDAKANRGEITEQEDDILFRSDSELAIEDVATPLNVPVEVLESADEPTGHMARILARSVLTA